MAGLVIVATVGQQSEKMLDILLTSPIYQMQFQADDQAMAQNAIALLNTLQTNFAIVDAIRKSGRKMNEQAIPEMNEWLGKIGYRPSDLNRLNIIHIAGTKGKGSTAAFVSSILTQFIGSTTSRSDVSLSKVGLYISPHLRFVRERIQINNRPLSEAQFARYFFEVWDRLDGAAQAGGQDATMKPSKPVYFRYLTLMAFHAYLSEGVDAAVIECGIGGKYDSTNVLEQSIVSGITSLGIDHVGVLGNTLSEIARHKAGVMRRGAQCYTVADQKLEANEVLEEVAEEQGTQLVYVGVNPAIARGDIRLGLQADFQKANASLAAELAREWLRTMGYSSDMEITDARIRRGLELVKWPGRCETREESNIRWCIDGGHTLESIDLTGRWFAGQLSKNTSKIRCLIFNQQTRDADVLAKALHNSLATTVQDDTPFTHAIFCTNTTFKDTGFRPDLVSANTDANDITSLRVQHQLATTWKEIDRCSETLVVRTIEEAVAVVRQLATVNGETTALVTGSLHLVGGFLEVLETSVKTEAE